MRSFRRPSVTPPTLDGRGPGGALRQSHEQDFVNTGIAPSTFPSHWTNADVKGALLAMQGPICAYCTADVSENAVDVEHFRPKGSVAQDKKHGGYWWLAYEFGNYVLSCTICNQKRKGNSFPLRPGGVHTQFPGRGQIHLEPRTLLDPAADRVEDWVEVDATDPLVPLRPTAGAPDSGRVRDAIDFFRLNRKVSQVKRRLELLASAADAIANGRSGSITADAVRYKPQSLLCWQLLGKNAPGDLPDALFEVEWLLARLCADLNLKLRLMQVKSTRLDQQECDELLWALAVLWKDPPTGNPADVESFLDTRGLGTIKALVLPKKALL